MEPVDAIRRFVQNIGRHAEADFWLNLFRSQSKERFATIVIDAPVIKHAFDAVVLDLRFLAALDLTPIVVLGVQDVIAASEHGHRLGQGLKAAGVNARRIEASSLYGKFSSIKAATDASEIPIVVFDETLDVESRFTLLGHMLDAMKVRKLMFLRRRGPLSENNVPIQSINLTTEYDHVMANPTFDDRERLLLRNCRRIACEEIAHRIMISITSPLDLLRELFTVKGAGTFLKRGAEILSVNNYEDLDKIKLRELIEASFGGILRNDFFDEPVNCIYAEEHYRGAAILCDTPIGGYLSKYVVERQAQGEGIGRDLWQRLLLEHNRLFWRSQAKNPINAFYIKEADGFTRLGKWTVFWKGLTPEEIPLAIRHALAQAEDIVYPKT